MKSIANKPKTILITGCSSGIGLATALLLQKNGYRVFASARNPQDVKRLNDMGLEGIPLDVNYSESIQKALNILLEKTSGTLDALFNNAGYVQAGAVEDLSRDMMQKQFETNVFGAMELTNAVIPIMRKQGHGRIIQNTSILGIVAMPYRGAYNASKFALEGFSHTLRQELKDSNITVSIIAPGPIHSALRKNALKHYENTLQHKTSFHRAAYDHMQRSFFPLAEGKNKFAVHPDQVAQAVLSSLKSTNPKAHYYVPFSAFVFSLLRRILPEKWLDALMIRINSGELKNDG